MLEFDPDIRGGQGYAVARDILDSGRALEKMQAIVRAQGASDLAPAPGRLCRKVHAPRAGYVTAIDNLRMANLARLAGAPMDKGAGVDLNKKLGDRVKKGELLYSIHADFPSDFRFATAMAEKDTGFAIGSEPPRQSNAREL